MADESICSVYNDLVTFLLSPSTAAETTSSRQLSWDAPDLSLESLYSSGKKKKLTIRGRKIEQT